MLRKDLKHIGRHIQCLQFDTMPNFTGQFAQIAFSKVEIFELRKAANGRRQSSEWILDHAEVLQPAQLADVRGHGHEMVLIQDKFRQIRHVVKQRIPKLN